MHFEVGAHCAVRRRRLEEEGRKELCLRYFERRWGRTKVKRVHREAKKNVRDVIFVASDIDTVLHIYIDCACHILPD